LTHLDGRLGQTLPPLFFQPGKLAKDHFEGRRQRHVPPFRLFLICLLIFIFALESLFHGNHQHTNVNVVTPGHTVTVPAGSDKVVTIAPVKGGGHAHVNFDIGAAPKGEVATVKVDGKSIIENGDGNEVGSAVDALDKDNDRSKVGGWLKPRLKKAIENKEYYLMVLFTWAHRLAFMLLPILAGLLALTYVLRRQFYIYDHLIVSMQFLSFVFLISAIAWILPDPVRGWAILVASIWVPINLYQTLRGAYGSSWWAAGIKAFFLWASTLTLFTFLMLGLMALALAEMA